MGERYKMVHSNNRVYEKTSKLKIDVNSLGFLEENRESLPFKLQPEIFEGILDNLPDYISLKKPDHTVLFYNKKGCEFLGLPLEKILGRKCYELIGRDKECEKCSAREAIINKETRGLEKYMAEMDIYLECISTPLLDKEGNVALVIEQHRDITQRKIAENALQESEERYRKLVECSPTAIIIEYKGRIVYANKAALKIAGEESLESLIGTPTLNYVHPDYIEEYKGLMEQVLVQGTNTPFIKGKILRSDETHVDVECSGIPFPYQGKPAAQLIIRDISRKIKMEEELLKASKLESIGLLAGGIAHDFNNLLAVIMGNISLSKKRLNEKEKLLDRLCDAEKALKQAVELTHQLRTFAQGGEPRTSTEDIVVLLKEIISLSLSGSKVKYDFYAPEETYKVEVDIGQINQVINNIILNAVQAMPRGGRIKVRVENFDIESKEQERDFDLERGKYVKISIEDEGTGIPRKSLDKIFDPFYSTKEEGSGLGLAICYSIIKKHRGKIEVESEEGKGTSFYIYLPASKEDYSAPGERKSVYFSRGGKILVMDDDNMVRTVVGEMLLYLGYRVEFAEDGWQAIEFYKEARESGQPYDAVLMDLTIAGGMGGESTIKELLEIDPEVKAIVASGYSHDPVMADFESHGFKGFITKPFSIEELSRVLHETLFN